MYNLLIALHYYVRQPGLLLTAVPAYLAEAARSGLQKVGLIVTDDVTTGREREALRLVFRKLQARYGVGIFHFHKEAQARFLEYLDGLKRWFELPLYANGRCMSLLVAAYQQARVVAFADLDTAPESNGKNLFQAFYELFENRRVMGVSGDYAHGDPRPLTDGFLKPNVREQFHDEITVCNGGLGPNQQSQRLVGGCMALRLELIKRFVPPPIDMAVWSDDALFAVAVTDMGFEVIDSGLTVNHYHDQGRIEEEWIIPYIAGRVARGIALMPIWEHCRPAILEFFNNGTAVPRERLEALLVEAGGWDEAVQRLDRYIKVLKMIAPDAIDDVRKKAVLQAAEKVAQEKDLIVAQVAIGFLDWISYLKDWQTAIDLIEQLDPHSGVGKDILDAIRI
jgi:hypothetical protein